VVGASGFGPPTSWSRTSLDQAKSVELTAFACAFPRLIWATWATKYRGPISSCSSSGILVPMTRHIFGSSSTASRTDGVEPLDDSVFELCARVCLLGGRRGRHATGL
jgi:hypothetical protein